MRKPLFVTIIIFLAVSVAAAADVGVSVSIGQPGFYGRIDIGDFPRPEIIYPRPIVIHPPQASVVEVPVYLHVPPDHARNWRQNCGRYNACGRPVYFVRDTWYNQVYVPRYQERKHRGGYGRNPGHGRGHN